ncbi:glycogen synthase GlgA [Saccharibacillus kuerlensis]|uniref:Glycogen synthase n=1 Tax=Saccharibacillus kuerlensis TaxID=459527 RepID=A0ABQ2L8S0_9BACL|nr:glycogen synthase GlgA [Saccharibacillus kuerlensis]GGO07111.1 glycogen synthase [Saccharibacillus kuerlensis]
MKLLFAAAEAAPFIKTGGLADVIGALPRALKEAGADIRVVLPKYSGIPDSYKEKLTHKSSVFVQLGWRSQYCGIEEYNDNGIPVYFIDNEFYFGRDGVYGYGDDGERFAFFSKAVLDILPEIGFKPDVIHCHDWHTGMVPLLLKDTYAHDPFYDNIQSVYTIHNLLYQGVFPYAVFGELLGLDNRHFTAAGAEYYGSVNFMKTGIVYADKVTTVSPTYAQEIRTAYYGYGLDGLLSSIGDKLTGIVNGIDTKSYNPNTDKTLHTRYKSSLAKKRENKTALQTELGLPVNIKTPMIGIVSRLVEPKGLDLVVRILDELLYGDDVQIVVLGTGEAGYEDWFRQAAFRHPNQLSAQIRFSETLSRNIYAASDMFLMPSMFEPCGISQLLAMRYGSVPIVRETGGLNDTVQAYNEHTGEGNGFSFSSYNAHDMLHTIRRALAFYRDEPSWKKIVQNGMSADFSWLASAKEYMGIYEQLKD